MKVSRYSLVALVVALVAVSFAYFVGWYVLFLWPKVDQVQQKGETSVVFKRTEACNFDECLAMDVVDGSLVGTAVIEGYYGSRVDEALWGEKGECQTFTISSGPDGWKDQFPEAVLGFVTAPGKEQVGQKARLLVLRDTPAERESMLCEPDFQVLKVISGT